MGLSDYYIGITYGFKLDKKSTEKATGCKKYKGKWDGSNGKYIGQCYETYVGLMRNPYILTKKDFDDYADDCYENYDDGTKIEELEEKVEMTASGDDFDCKINSTEPYLSLHTIKVSGWYDNIIDPEQMIQLEKSIDPLLIQKTKTWAESKGLILINKEPQWFTFVHTLYY